MSFEGGGVWVISEKNILQTDRRGKKFIARKYLKKIHTLKKYYISFMAYNVAKKSYTLVCQENNFTAKGLGKKFLQK